jgi:hypothetical protein
MYGQGKDWYSNIVGWAPVQGGEAGARAGSPGSEGSEEERRRQARMQRNRESAQQSRARRKAQLDELERRNGELAAHNTHLSGARPSLFPPA